MAKKGENIYIRKDGRWEGRYIKGRRTDGKCHYGYVYAKSYRETKKKLNDQKQALHRYILEPLKAEDAPVSNIKFGNILADWLNSRRHQIKESTYVKYRNIINCYILPVLGNINWNDLNRDILESFCSQMLASGGRKGKGLSSKTTADTMSLIRSAFRHASVHGYRPPCDVSSVFVKRTSKELRILSRNEQEQLCRYLHSNMDSKNLGILICLFTGLRIGEICALKWEDISFAEQTIYVHQTMQRIQTERRTGKKTEIIISTPKSKCSIRRIPIVGELMNVLVKFRNGRNGYVLTGRESFYIEPRTMQRHFKRVLQEAKLEDINYHVLRHTFATRCVEMNFDVKSLSEILGHASVNITMNRYVHPSMDLKRANMQRLSELFSNYKPSE